MVGSVGDFIHVSVQLSGWANTNLAIISYIEQNVNQHLKFLCKFNSNIYQKLYIDYSQALRKDLMSNI